MSKLKQLFKWVPAVYGLFSIVLGLMVIIGWWSKNPILTSILPNYVPVAFNVAVVFVLLGLSLFLFNRNEKCFSLLSAMLATVVLGLTALEYITGKNLLIDELFFKGPHCATIVYPGRMVPNTLIAFCLLALSQILLIKSRPNKWISFLTLLLSQFACAIGWLSLLGYCLKLESTYHWLNLTPMALGTSIGIIVLSMGVLALTIKEELNENTHFSYRYEVLICSLGLFLTFSFWLALFNEEEDQIKQLTEQRMITFKAQLTEKLSGRFNALKRITERWTYANGTNYGAWENDVKHYIEDQPEYLSIAWIDKAYHTRWFYPRNENGMLLGQNSDKKTELLTKSQTIGKGLSSSVFALPTGQKEIFYVSPIRNRNGQFDGFISGTYQLEELLKSIVNPDSKDFTIHIYQNNQLIFGKQGDRRNALSSEGSLELQGLNWKITVSPTNLLVRQIESPLANVVLFIGTLLLLRWVNV